MAVFGCFFSCAESYGMLKMGKFGRNGKPIALLFGKKWLFLGSFSVVLKVDGS